MGTELGKWLMDVAKYIATAVLLSSVFGDVTGLWTIIIVISTILATLVVGLILIKNNSSHE